MSSEIDNSCVFCYGTLPCEKLSCKRASDRREQMYAYLKPPKRVLCQDPEYIKKAIDALQRAGAQRVLTASMQSLPDEYHALIEGHQKHQCDCAEKCKQYITDRRIDDHNYWHVKRGEPCDCDESMTEEEWQDALLRYCENEIAEIKRRGRYALKAVQIPVLDEDSIRLYRNYAGRHLKMTDELKNRIEVIEGLVMDATLAKCIAIDPPNMEVLFPKKAEEVLWMPDDDGSARRIGTATPVPRAKKEGKYAGYLPSRPWKSEEKELFDANLQVHRDGYRPSEVWKYAPEDKPLRDAERLTKQWVKEFIAEKPPGAGGREQALKDLDRLFGIKTTPKSL